MLVVFFSAFSSPRIYIRRALRSEITTSNKKNLEAANIRDYTSLHPQNNLVPRNAATSSTDGLWEPCLMQERRNSSTMKHPNPALTVSVAVHILDAGG